MKDFYGAWCKEERNKLLDYSKKRYNYKVSSDNFLKFFYNSGFIFHYLILKEGLKKDKLRDIFKCYIESNKGYLEKEKGKLEYYLNPEDMPPISGYFKINFSLKKHYISKDEDLFYFLENPVMKEGNFKVPMIQASSWKGNFRWMGIKLLVKKICRR